MPHTKANNYVVLRLFALAGVAIPGELPRFRSKVKQAATIGANPKVTFCIFKKPVSRHYMANFGVRKAYDG